MMGRVRTSHVAIALGLVAALAIASPAIGGPSLKQLVKKEVSKQISKATGPQGPAGANGTNGTNGLDGTARAYADVASDQSAACSPECSFARSKGITSVTHPGTGIYCVTAPGISPTSVSAVASGEWGITSGPEGNTVVMTRASAASCPAGNFEVVTERHQNVTVNAGAGTNNATAVGPAAVADNVAFTIVIP